MTEWRPKREALTAPIFRSLAEQIANAIDDGRLPDRTRLMPQRQLADELGVSLQTVSRAYEDLVRRGLLSGEAGRGTFVTRPQSDRGPPFTLQRIPELIDLSILKPVSDNIHIERMGAALASLSATVPSRIVQAFRPESAGSRHRQAGLAWLRLCGVETSAFNVCVTNGATPALAVALMTSAPPGSTVATEVVGHHSLRPLASYLGVNLTGIAVDEQGIIPDAFEEACREQPVRALFVQPSVINPPATLLREERRRAIAAIAERFDVLIIENDPLGPLISQRPPSLFSLAPDRTFYVTSFTKIVMPGLRIGYLVIPQRFIATATNRHLVTGWMATPLLEEIATGWIEDGTAIGLVDWQREALSGRHQILNEAFGGLSFSSHPEGLHAWIPLPAGHQETGFAAHAKALGIAVATGSSFLSADHEPYPAIRVSVGSVAEEQLRSGVATLAGILRAPPEPPLPISH